MNTRATAICASRPLRPVLLLALALATTLSLLGSAAPAGATGARPTFASISPNHTSVGNGEQKEFTIALTNTGSSAKTTNVMVKLPGELKPVSGSYASGGQEVSAGITWSNVSVPANSVTRLTFKVTPAGSITAEKTVIMLALISGSMGVANLPAAVTLTTTPPPANFSSSSITAAPTMLAHGEQATYTIVLKNTGGSSATATVTATPDARLTYVDGSASPTPSSTTSGSLTWANVTVPANAEATLTFKASLDIYVNAPSLATTTARVETGGQVFTLSTAILLIQQPLPPPPSDPLAGSFKTVSRDTLAPGETVTYTIFLNNSSTSDVVADVSDPLPAELAYEDKSANPAAGYENNTLSWDDITVPAGKTVELSFRVSAAAAVERPTAVINVAKITVDDQTFTRRAAPLLLLPAPPPPAADTQRPRVTKVTIGDGDVLTDPNVTLHIDADDNVRVTKMQVREWTLDRSGFLPRWRVVRSSGLVDYQPSYPWTLDDTAGTHFVGVWVQDAAGNTSVLTRAAMDYASLLKDGATLAARDATPYMVHLDQGQSVSAVLTTISGDADLYVWYPGGFGLPDARSIAGGAETDSVSFTAPVSGGYIFLVYGFAASTYSLRITPGAAAVQAFPSAEPGDKEPGLLFEPILSSAGIDPLATVSAEDGSPVTPATGAIYLPIVAR